MQPLMSVSFFKYPGRILPASEEKWPMVVSKLRKARKKWERLSRVMGQEGVDARAMGIFYREVVQVVLLFGLDTWVM